MIVLIAQGIGFGLNAGVLPGPLQSFLISTTLSQGWRRGLMVVISPALVDAPIIILMTVFLNQLPPGVISLIQIIGGLFVLWLAWGTWRSLQAGTLVLTDENAAPQGKRRVLGQAMTINYLSPGPYIFWGTITGPLLVEALAQSVWVAAAFLLAFYGTFLTILTALVFLFDRLRRVDARLTYRVIQGALVVMVILGVQLVLQGVF